MTFEMSRRTVVGVAGAAGALAVLPLGPALAAGRQVRVGFLTAQGSSYSGAADGLVDGFTLAASDGGLIVTADRRDVVAGYAGALGAAEEVIDAGADVIVAGVSPQALVQLAPRCSLAGVGLLVANSGARVTATDVGGSAIVNSLQLWQSWLVAGGWAARELGSRMFVIASAPDAGYDTIFAVRRGFTAAGGSVVGLATTHEAEGDGVAAAVTAARGAGAQVVAVCATGSRAATIITALRRAGVKAAILADPLAVEDFSRPALGHAARGVYSASSWSRELDTAANRRFASDFRARFGRAPDAFAALGHDTGRLLVSADERGISSWRDLGSVLRGRTVSGARGTQRVHPRLGTVATPIGIRQVVAKGAGSRNKVLATRRPVIGVAAQVAALENVEVSAYFNEYLTT